MSGFADVAVGAASPSGSSPMSSGRLRSNRLIGASTTRIRMPIAVQAVRQPVCSIISCTHGSSGDRADADAGEGKPHRQAAAAD